ncbi:MAG: hypothetical protein EA419_03905 [Wenzhouxiangella sp.]|nr:MAG: hypothetical protein EA419_03905 [Wenzhouxiangella sp.]
MGKQSFKREASQRLRQEVAAEAARIIATEGQRSYLAAKHKAAARVGVATRGGLPSNAEIERALKEWQSLYGGNEHAERLQVMRAAALEAMLFLEPFQPRLVGPVLEGTADEYSRVCLHLFSEDPDAVVRFLMEHGIEFEQERRRIRWRDGSHREVDVLVVEAGEQTVEMTLMIGRDAIHPPPSPIDGQPLRRIGTADLRALINND